MYKIHICDRVCRSVTMCVARTAETPTLDLFGPPVKTFGVCVFDTRFRSMQSRQSSVRYRLVAAALANTAQASGVHLVVG
jgi:hypothetical protein